jgi:hypothetical protein
MNDFDVLGLENSVEGGGEFHIVIMDQKADARIALFRVPTPTGVLAA